MGVLYTPFTIEETITRPAGTWNWWCGVLAPNNYTYHLPINGPLDAEGNSWVKHLRVNLDTEDWVAFEALEHELIAGSYFRSDSRMADAMLIGDWIYGIPYSDDTRDKQASDDWDAHKLRPYKLNWKTNTIQRFTATLPSHVDSVWLGSYRCGAASGSSIFCLGSRNTVGWISSVNDSFTEFGDLSHLPSGERFHSMVTAPNGARYGIPGSSPVVLKIESNLTITELGDLGTAASKWVASCVTSSGIIYAAPGSGASTILRVDTTADTVQTLTIPEGIATTYQGIVLGDDGYIYLVPGGGVWTRLDPATHKITKGPDYSNQFQAEPQAMGTLISGTDPGVAGVFSRAGLIYTGPTRAPDPLKIHALSYESLELPESVIRKPLFIKAGQIRQGAAGEFVKAPETGLQQVSVTNGGVTTLVKGSVVYVSADQTVEKAQANSVSTAGAVGLVADTSIAAAGTGHVYTGGLLEATPAEWAQVTETGASLISGAAYYVSVTSPGKITHVPPSGLVGVITKIGTAASATELCIKLHRPIQLYFD